MRWSFVISVLCSLIFNIVKAQNVNSLLADKPISAKYQYVYDERKLSEHIYAKLPSSLKQGKDELKSFAFAIDMAASINEDLTNFNCYHNWEDLEDYLNQILRKVIPEELKSDTMIRAVITKSSQFNAAMTPAGIMMVNIGFLTYVQDESMIAAAFCHELAHYQLAHSARINLENQRFDFTVDPLGKFFKHSRRFELEADSLGMIWYEKTDFAIMGFMNVFKALRRLEKHEIRKDPEEWKMDEYTHPLTKSRSENIANFYKKYLSTGGEKFLVNKDLFFKYKEMAKNEALYYALKEFSFRTCMESAFRFHILDPDNPTYVYYLMESIRRLCYYKEDRWKDPFFVDVYFENRTEEELESREGRIKVPFKYTIFSQYDEELLLMSPSEMKEIKAQFYWDNPSIFKTFEEAFNFYATLGNKLNCKECVFSNALSFINNKTNLELLIKEYIQFPEIKYKQLAEDLLSKKAYESPSRKRLTLVVDMDFLSSVGRYQFPIAVTVPDQARVFTPLFDSVVSIYNFRKFEFLNGEFKRKSEYDSELMYQMLNFIMTVPESKQIAGSFYVLCPDYYYLFRKYDVDEIEYLYFRYFETNNLSRDLNQIRAYQSVSLDNIMQIKGRTRYYVVGLIGVFFKQDKVKLPIVGFDETEIPFKEETSGIVKKAILKVFNSKADWEKLVKR